MVIDKQIRYLYPDAVFGLPGEAGVVCVLDDGNSQTIIQWPPHLGPQPTEQQLAAVATQATMAAAWRIIRQKRDELLRSCDFTQLSDFPDQWKLQDWKNYRRALRDIPQTYSSPENVVWPTPP